MNNEIKGMVYEVGSLLPEIANGEPLGWGGRLAMDNFGALSLYCMLKNPVPEDVAGFKTLRAVGLYQPPELMQGLLLWQFNNNLIAETPFNPTLYHDNRVKQMGEANLMHRFLVDTKGILRSMNVYGLHQDILQKMKSIWTDPTLDWDDYTENIVGLYSEYSTDELWGLATRKWVCTNNADNK